MSFENRRRFLTLSIAVQLVLSTVTGAQTSAAHGWQVQNLPFRILAVTSHTSSFWICGVDESIAASSDGRNWQIKHSKHDGSVLLTIGFANEKFGYAAGSGGVFLTTEDGGGTWAPHSAGNESIFQISFSDPQHGLIQTRSSLVFTRDGGSHWLPISLAQNAEQLKAFPYVLSLVALDPTHMGVMLKKGPAQYFAQSFLVTGDSGESWKFINVPNVTLYSFLAAEGKYWAIGTEVIHKKRPDGGYAVPVALYSSDGERWTHSTADLASCKPEMCVACTPRGCLSANGTITGFFADKTTYESFPPNPHLSANWAAVGSSICFAGKNLECSEFKSAAGPSANEGPLPVKLATVRHGIASMTGPQCLLCDLQPIFDASLFGAYKVGLVLGVARNGTVSSVVVKGAPTPGVRSQLEEQIRDWIFEPNGDSGALGKIEGTISVGVVPRSN